MHSPSPSKKTIHQRAYTLVEALVASSILLIGIAAAGSMSLTLLTQEEINERSIVAANYLDNAARLYQIGVDPADIPNLLPEEPLVDSLTFSSRDLTVSGLGTVPSTTLTLSYHPSPAKGKSVAGNWTGGDADATRQISVEVIRASSHIIDPLPRVQHFGP
ncbi:MAG: type II secretion system protein [Verrucomicrobiales bacterium]|nr:type II secretion system protein [Verrucomicrobiales bacterium]